MAHARASRQASIGAITDRATDKSMTFDLVYARYTAECATLGVAPLPPDDMLALIAAMLDAAESGLGLYHVGQQPNSVARNSAGHPEPAPISSRRRPCVSERRRTDVEPVRGLPSLCRRSRCHAHGARSRASAATVRSRSHAQSRTQRQCKPPLLTPPNGRVRTTTAVMKVRRSIAKPPNR